MSKRLNLTFYILLICYITLSISNIWAILNFINDWGIQETFKNTNIFYNIAIILLIFFIFKKKYYILPVVFLYSFYKLLTSPVLGVHREGLGAIVYIYNSFINGFWQSFFLLLSSWLIPIVSLIGCIYWYLDIKKSKSLDKHWSE
ncbi:hypothetical protein AB9G22_09495 [Francisella philomiragia]|uniref:hypothetical protein n=1 Tax=Francisella philomiragia TaxID=28110 RepID=UPI003514E47D